MVTKGTYDLLLPPGIEGLRKRPADFFGYLWKRVSLQLFGVIKIFNCFKPSIKQGTKKGSEHQN